MDLAHHLRNPSLVALNEDGLIGQFTCIGEQIVQVLHAIVSMRNSLIQTGHILRLSMLQNSSLQRAQTLGILQDLLHIIMGQSCGGTALVVKDIVLHFVIVLLVVTMFNIAAFFQSFADQIGNGGFLLFIQGIKNLLDSLIAAFRLLLILRVSVLVLQIFILHVRILLLFFVCMDQFNTASSPDICIIEIVTIVAMGQVQLFDICFGVCPSQNKTYFLNIAMRDNICKLVSG